MHLHLFKVNARETYVTAVPPTPVDLATAPAIVKEIVAFLEGHPGSTRQLVLEGLRPGANPESPGASEVLLHLGNLVANGGVIEFFNATLALPRGGLRPEAKKPEGLAAEKGTPEETTEEVQEVTLPESEEPQLVVAEIPVETAEPQPDEVAAREPEASASPESTSLGESAEPRDPAAEVANPE
jgi:hypothetical protein